jgi:chemotaxis family two-component system sensor kinase Cph1
VSDVPATGVTLDNCDREPIHIPGLIQPHGALLAFDGAGVLTYRSANADGLLGDTLPALGEALADRHLIDYDGFHSLLDEVRDEANDDVIPHAMQVENRRGSFDVIVHRSAQGVVCEFEDASGAVPLPAGSAFAAHRGLERLKREQTVDGLLAAAVAEVRRMIGFDRVMAYRFRPDDSGEVVAEAAHAALDPYLGRRYPASDIPAQARRLYVINTLRWIADVKATPVPVRAAAGVAAPLDMSHAVLRSVSPIHVEYLTNMGVAASLSVSIVIGGRLWGMLACHHRQPRRVAYTVRMACDVLAQVLASNLQGMLAQARVAEAEAAASMRGRVAAQVLHANDIVRALLAEAPALRAGFGAHAVVVAEAGRVETDGAFERTTAAALLQWLGERNLPVGRLVNLDSLADVPAALREQMGIWRGLLALPFGTEVPSWVLLLRKEQIETVLWGGKPEKTFTTGPLGPRLTPRGSFELWREIVKGRAEAWSEMQLDSAQTLLDELVRADSAHAAEIGRARGRLMAMLGHDLRDPIQSITMTATLMERRGDDTPLRHRLQNSSNRMQRLVEQVMDMSQAHSGSLTFNMQTADLAVIAEDMVTESRTAYPDLQITLTRPPALVIEGDVDRIAQVLGNLLSNARHYGAPGEPVQVELAASGGMAIVQVVNEAPRIPDEVAVGLFQPFKREVANGSSNRNGLGLGLYIAERVVAGHGGTLVYSYRPPHVIFTASFPVPPGQS